MSDTSIAEPLLCSRFDHPCTAEMIACVLFTCARVFPMKLQMPFRRFNNLYRVESYEPKAGQEIAYIERVFDG
jgi:hypothetical protein